jgi:hypothetical protein
MGSATIRTFGAPRVTTAGRDVLAFHLHRYLAHWLAKTERDRIWVTCGFAHSTVPFPTIEVGRRSTTDADVPWTFEDLAHSYHHGGTRLHIEHPDEDHTLEAIPLVEESTDGVRVLIGFAVVEGEDLEASALAELEVHASEAIRAARRNDLRLFFDETDERDMKALLYATLDRVPEWTGCDVAAAVVLSNSLEAMALDRATEADFYVMAERLFVEADDELPTRLVGMTIDTRDDVRTVVDAAIERLQRDPEDRLQRYVRTAEGYIDADGDAAVSIGVAEPRPKDASSIIAPLVVEEDDEQELLGFLCLAFSGARGAPRSVDESIASLTERLAYTLRHSPLYTLSASKLRLIRGIRAMCEAQVARDAPAAERREAIVSGAVALAREHTEVPAFSVGWIRRENDVRHLVYEASYGWTDFQQIELVVDVEPDERVDSGVSALSVRLNRPLVLAGGQQTKQREFKNFLWVHEETGRIVDTRAPGGDVVEKESGWTRLGEYYKPARQGAYATVAHPITFDGHPLGVVAIEVDRDTDWYWWTGYGGQLLWELVASELAFAFWAIGAGVES